MARPGDLNACINAHGLYNSLQFVLRLSPEIHRKLEAFSTPRVVNKIDAETVRAFSTYLHETVHWWQHIGSTIGFILSLSYPAQAHANYTHLKNLLRLFGPKKSLLRLVETNLEPGGFGTPIGLANTVVNNYFDIHFFRHLVTEPSLAHEVGDHILFECVGHSYQITYANVVLLLATTVDREFSALPDPRSWEAPFEKLRSDKERGYYHGSPVAYNADKSKRPEFFCWPGAWMVGERLSPEAATLFERHAALFVDKADDDGVFPRLLENKDEALLQRTFDSFYAFNVGYDMAAQWTASSGPFVYDYQWLSSSGTPEQIKGFADRHFEMIYGVPPDDFELI